MIFGINNSSSGQKISLDFSGEEDEYPFIVVGVEDSESGAELLDLLITEVTEVEQLRTEVNEAIDTFYRLRKARQEATEQSTAKKKGAQ